MELRQSVQALAFDKKPYGLASRAISPRGGRPSVNFRRARGGLTVYTCEVVTPQECPGPQIEDRRCKGTLTCAEPDCAPVAGHRRTASYARHRVGVIASSQGDLLFCRCNADAEGVISAFALVAKR